MKRIWWIILLIPVLLFFPGCQDPVEEETFTEADALALEQSFEEALIQETTSHDETNPEPEGEEPIIPNTLVKNFSDKESLVNHLQNYMSERLAQGYVDTYYEEKNGNLYLIPMDGPILIIEEEPMTLTRLENGRYQLTQSVDSDFIGPYTLIITYEEKEEGWIIADRIVES